jgi:hypothetical protein
MNGGVEWIPPDPSTGAEGESLRTPRELAARDELFSLGKDPVPPTRLARLAGQVTTTVGRSVAVAAAAALVVAYVVASHRTHHAASEADSHNPAAEQVATDRAMALIETSALSSGPLQDYIRSNSSRGACALVSVGQSPQAAIAAAIHRALPDYSVRDASRTIDQFTALCAISVRAVDAQGSVLVVVIAAPQQATARAFTALTVGARSDAFRAVSIATALTKDGWSITVGVVGPLVDEPSSADLQRLSQDAGLLW